MSRLSLLYDVHRVAYLTDQLVERSLVDQELSGTDFALYSYLVVNGPATVSAVADSLAASLASTSKLLARADERSHLIRRPNPEDGRSTLVELNEAGLAVRAAAAAPFRTALRGVVEGLGGSVEDVRWALARLDDALAASLDQPLRAAAGEAPSHRMLSYQGAPLTAGEEDEARRYIAWLQHQRQQA